MKTAMQEMIDILKEPISDGYNSGDYYLLKAKELLETEKQQIVDAFEKGIEKYCQYDPERHGNEFPKGTDYFTRTYTP